MAFQEFASGLYSNEFIALLVNLFRNEIFYYTLGVLTVLALVVLDSNAKRAALIAAILITAVSLPLVKEQFAEARPCYDQAVCDDGFGFPSGHSALAFILVGATLGTVSFYFFLPLAAFIALSRVIAGVHTLDQIAGGMVFGFIIYLLCEKAAVRFFNENKNIKTTKGVKNARRR